MSAASRWWAGPLWLLVCALAQTTLIPALGFRQVRPELVLQSVVLIGILRGAREAVIWAFLGGLLLDAFAGTPFGATTLPLLFIGFLAGAADSGVFGNVVWLPPLAVLVASVLNGTLLLIILTSLGQTNPAWLGTLWAVVVPTALLNTVSTPLTYAIVRRIVGGDRLYGGMRLR